MKLTIITVCFNALADLKKTHASIEKQTHGPFEYIVIDGGSTDETKSFLASSKIITRWVSEPDRGIYDAMNKGLDLATGDALLFLNAGDYIQGDFLSKIKSAPGLIPVQTKVAGIFPKILKPKNYKSGLPYCHQGIIFEKKMTRYNTDLKIAADYEFYLEHGYTQLPFLITADCGFIVYDNFGISSQRSLQRDSEIEKIIRENFGFFFAFKFNIICKVKRVIKFFLRR